MSATDDKKGRGGLRHAMWPALLVTVLTGMGFAGLKFVLIGEIALDFDPQTHVPLGVQWMEDVLQRALAKGTLKEAITQGLAAVLTLGVLVGYLVNAPLAGAWRVGALFVLSSAGVAVGTLLTMWVNPWPVALVVGIAYGTACAARGKAVPLLAAATGRSNTLVSGVVNASLVISLLAGTVFGTLLSEKLDPPGARHVVLFCFVVFATLLALLVRPPEPPAIPFRVGVRELMTGTVTLMRERWALIVSGGMAWGIASAAVLAAFIDAIERLEMKPESAVALVIYPAVGAILGNLASHWMDRRRHVIVGYVCLALAIGFYPYLVTNTLSGAVMMFTIGFLFSAPTNVLDARLLAYAAAQGHPGRGSTVMSLVHNVFILGIGTSLAVALFLGVMKAEEQFYWLAGISLLTGVVVIKAHLRDSPRTGGVTTVVPPVLPRRPDTV
jgi:MFS family permease